MDNLVYVHWYLARETEPPIVTFPRVTFKPRLALAIALTTGSLLANMGDPALAARTLKRGYRGADVIELQDFLKDIGCFDTRVNSTGLFGRITQGAVKEFQSANGLRADGVFGPKTQALLERSYYNSCSSETPNIVQNQNLQNSGSPKMGHRGENVRLIQKQLSNWGFPVRADGVFGNQTRDAVKRFQKYHGLKQDGVVGKVTSQILWSPRFR